MRLNTRRGFPLVFSVLFAFTILSHCNSCGSTNPNNSENSQNPGMGNPTTPSNGGSGVPSGNNPSDFPTISNLNFSAFPKDPGTYSGSRTLYVATNGNDTNPGTQSQPFRSIVHALNTALSGDLVIVRGGTYVEAQDYRGMVIEHPLILSAAPGEAVQVTPGPGASYGLVINSSNVIVDGLNLSGFSNDLVTVGETNPISQVILKNMKLTASGINGGITSPCCQMNGLLVKNVEIRNAMLGISCNIGPCHDWRIEGTKILGSGRGDTAEDGIAMENGSGSNGNIQSDNVLITNTEVTGAGGDGIDLKATRVAVFNSNIHNNARNGVKFWKGGDLVNSFVIGQGPSDAIIVFDQGGTYRILNSLIANNNFPGGGSYTLTAGYGNYSEPINLSIINSVFYNNPSALYLSPGTQASFQNDLFGNTVDDKIASRGDNQGGESLQVLESNPVTALSQLSNAANNLPFTTNPLFTNPAGNDYTFPSTSSLKNAGTVPTLFPSYDYRGQTRVQGGSPDLGPLELF